MFFKRKRNIPKVREISLICVEATFELQVWVPSFGTKGHMWPNVDDPLPPACSLTFHNGISQIHFRSLFLEGPYV